MGQSIVVATEERSASPGLAAERVRVAHELHDGVIQTLTGISLGLAALERRGATEPVQGSELAETHRLVRHCIAELRDIIANIRPAEFAAADLAAVIAETADRFGRDTGIRTQCVCVGEPANLSPQMCTHLLRLIQEALMNVRRHSGAGNVVVSVTFGDDSISLVVDDDGCGFPFDGRWTHDDLDRSRRGPLVIKERVRLLSGSLVIQSTPGQGARLEVSVPGRFRA